MPGVEPGESRSWSAAPRRCPSAPAHLQDFCQPAWTRVAGGCHPNRETERTVEAAGFHIDAEGRRARGVKRRFVARPLD